MYDAVFDDDAFDHLLERLAQALGARSFVAGWHFRDRTATLFRCSGHWSPEQMATYNHDFAFTDIWNVSVLRQWTPNRALDMAERVSDQEYRNSSLYNDFIRPLGDDTWRAVTVPAESALGVGAIAFHRGRSSRGFSSEAVRLLDAYAPHLGRLLGLRGRMAALDRELDTANAINAAVGQAVMLLDGAGRLLRANPAAERMVFETGALLLRQGVVAARAPATDRALKAALAKALARTEAEAGAVAIPTGDGGQLILSLIAVRSAAGRHVLVAVTDPSARDATRPARLRALYGLSPGEAMIAVRLAEGASPAEIAEQRQVGMETVRSQIKTIAAKLGCSRQTEIGRIVHSLPPLHPAAAMDDG